MFVIALLCCMTRPLKKCNYFCLAYKVQETINYKNRATPHLFYFSITDLLSFSFQNDLCVWFISAKQT